MIEASEVSKYINALGGKPCAGGEAERIADMLNGLSGSSSAVLSINGKGVLVCRKTVFEHLYSSLSADKLVKVVEQLEQSLESMGDVFQGKQLRITKERIKYVSGLI